MEFDVIDVSPFKEFELLFTPVLVSFRFTRIIRFDYYNGPVSVNQFNEARMYAHTFGVNTSFAYVWHRNSDHQVKCDCNDFPP